MAITIIKKRADFLLAASSGFKFVKSSVVVQSRKREPSYIPESDIRIGFTATKKLGNAVIRNRAKRRMREAAQLLITEFGIAGCDYVFIGREPVYKGTYENLLSDMKHALKRLGKMMMEKEEAASCKES